VSNVVSTLVWFDVSTWALPHENIVYNEKKVLDTIFCSSCAWCLFRRGTAVEARLLRRIAASDG
jgi:hypothetical protein